MIEIYFSPSIISQNYEDWNKGFHKRIKGRFGKASINKIDFMIGIKFHLVGKKLHSKQRVGESQQ